MQTVIGAVIFVVFVVVAGVCIRRRDRNDVSSGETSLKSTHLKVPTREK